MDCNLSGRGTTAFRSTATTIPTKYAERAIPQISLASFETRIDEIIEQLCDAAEKVGFFALVDHGIAVTKIEDMLSTSEAFFALPDDVEATVPWKPQNVGWEKKSQVRPSTGAADQKESYQLQFGENMEALWIGDEHAPSFKEKSLNFFMMEVQAISEKLMVCFLRGLGFDDDHLIMSHDVSQPNSQSAFRLLRYYATPETMMGKYTTEPVLVLIGYVL